MYLFKCHKINTTFDIPLDRSHLEKKKKEMDYYKAQPPYLEKNIKMLGHDRDLRCSKFP